MDKNGDGQVNRTEMLIALRKDKTLQDILGLPSSFKQGSTEHTVFEYVFQRLDSDGSTHISEDQWLRYFLPTASYIRNCDTPVSVASEDVGGGVPNNNETDIEYGKMLKAAGHDLDGDGLVSADEFDRVRV